MTTASRTSAQAPRPRRVVVTGAGGYIGHALSERLVAQLEAGDIDALTLVDVALPASAADHAGLRRIEGDLAAAEILAQAVATRPELVFHLAGVTSRIAEQQPALSLRTNVLATTGLFERLAAQGNAPVLVYASSIGVHGTPLPERIDDDTPPRPTLSYGTHKRIGELLLADYARRGAIDGRAVRLSGVVARPLQPAAALSAFAGDMMRHAATGGSYTCPVGPRAQVLLISLPLCVDHLLRVASLDRRLLPSPPIFHLPALRVRIGELADALRKRFPGSDIDFDPQPQLEAQFGRWPAVHAETAGRLGFEADRDLQTLITRALEIQPP
ncbi:MAG TPA: NAD-dependent epimerase/dehydratase family protein [Nevskiaceae bacterium]